MRDIRPDLQERLAAVAAERERLQAELDRQSLQETTLRDMLALEEAKFASALKGPAPSAVVNPSPAWNEVMEGAILQLLSNGTDWPHGDIKHHLEQRNLFRPDDAQHGRTLQGVLMSMRHRGYVELVQGMQGVWRKAKAQTTAFSILAPQTETGANPGPGRLVS